MVTGGAATRRWTRLLRTPGFWRLEPAALVARLPMGMVSLLLLLLLLVLVTTAHRGSYTAAGIVTACYGAGAGVGAPFRGRMVDRIGIRPVLAVAGPGQAAAFLLFLAASALGWPGGPRHAQPMAAGSPGR